MRFPDEARESVENNLDDSIPAAKWQRFCNDMPEAVRKDYWRMLNDPEEADKANSYLAHHFQGWDSKGKGTRAQHRLEPSSDPRWEAVAQILAIRARRDQDLIAFRGEVLNGRTIAMADIESWIRTKAEEEGPATRLVTHPSDDPNTIIQRRIETIRYVTTYDVSDVQIQSIRVGGVLWHLRVVARRLATGFGWPEEWTTAFVLTDIPPPRPIVFGYTIHEGSFMPSVGWLELRINPLAVDPRDLERSYRKIRQDLIQGKRVDSVTDKSAALAIFWENTDGMSTGDRRGLWNRTVGKDHPDWVYPDAGGNFGRDARMALRNITGERTE